VLGGATLFLALGVLAATASWVAGAALCLLLIGAIGLVIVGLERAAFVVLLLAFATAPMYRGLEGLSGGLATPTDLFVVLAAGLLLVTVMSRPLDLPSPFVIGLTLVAVFGLVSSLLSDSILGSVFVLVQWLFFLGAVPILIAWWRPGTRTIVPLLWAYVVGQTASTAYALATGPVVGDRYQGLSHHTNAFGMAGMTAIAILMYLWAHHRTAPMRAAVLAAGAISAASIIMSGSRAALVVAAVLVLIMPVVERSAVSGFVFAIFGALGLIAFEQLVGTGHGGSALTRLAGKGTAVTADQARTSALDEGLKRLWDSPIFGSGLFNVELYHDIFLEVAIGTGLFGLVGYLMIMFVLSRPLITLHPQRRLSYLPLAWIGMGPALPGIWDRTMWVPIGLSILAVLKQPPPEEATVGEDSAEVVRPVQPAPGLGRGASA
jgi:hypothetical protein